MSQVVVRCCPKETVRIRNLLASALNSDEGDLCDMLSAICGLTTELACRVGVVKGHLLNHISESYEDWQENMAQEEEKC